MIVINGKMKNLSKKIRGPIAFTSAIMFLMIFAYGCFKGPIEGMEKKKKEQTPYLVWPKRPDIPRIQFLYSITGPKDLQSKGGFIRSISGLFRKKNQEPIVRPYGVEADREGRLYVVDSFRKRVHVFDFNKKKYYYFPRKETILTSPIDIAIDNSSGRVYVTDSKEGVVKRFKNFGKKYAGEIGRGVIDRPTGIAINKTTSELLVVDTLNANIIRYSLSDNHLIGVVGREGDEEGKFHYPTDIYVSEDGLVLINDSLNFRVQVLSPELKFLREFGNPGDAPGYFSRPKGVATDSEGNIYVVDALFDNVQVFDPEGRLLMDFGGPGHEYGEFWLPSGIYIDESDKIYIADSFNKRVQVFQYLK